MKYSVTKKQTINKPINDIYNNIANLSNWEKWSPWACIDKETIITADNENLSWTSQFTGSGIMKIVSKTDNEIHINLEFIKPFSSKADVLFKLRNNGNDTTDVTWNMQSSLPLFMIFLRKLFKVMLGRDFDRGLTRLSYLCETGKVPSSLEFHDTPSHISSFKIAGISSKTHMSAIANNMNESMTKLKVLINQAKVTPIIGLCFVDKYQVVNEVMHYTVGAKYDGADISLGELQSKTIPAHKAIKITLHGSYEFLGDGWSAIHSRVRGLGLKHNKQIPPYEVYINGPHNTEKPEDYVTEIYMPVK